MAAIGRQDDQALSARIPFMAAGPSKARTLQAAYMTATVSMPHPPQNSLALACERGPYMTVESLRLSTSDRLAACPQQHEMLARRFLDASSSGDIGSLLALLSNEIVLYADGGGKAAAVPNRIYGRDHVARFVIGAIRKFVPQQRVTRVVGVNGQIGLVSYFEGRPGSVITFGVEAGLIRNIYIVSNPEQLARLPMLAAENDPE